MGGRGNAAARNSRSPIDYKVTEPSRGQRIAGEDILTEAKDSLNRIVEDYGTEDVDRIYEALADYYPQSMYDDDSQKVMKVDLKNGTVDLMEFSIRNDMKPGKLSIELSPLRFDLDEFNDEELSYWNIKKTGRNKYEWL